MPGGPSLGTAAEAVGGQRLPALRPSHSETATNKHLHLLKVCYLLLCHGLELRRAGPYACAPESVKLA